MSNGSKIRENNWKVKALAKRKEVNSLKKRVEELTRSRDSWKLKYQNRNQNKVGQVHKTPQQR